MRRPSCLCVSIIASASRAIARSRAGVDPGDRVLVLGRVRRDGDALVIRATGPESLWILGDPAGVVRALLRRAALALGVIAVGVAGLVAAVMLAG